MAIEHVTDHEEQAADRLLEQFKGKPRLRAFIAALSAEVQAIEDALWQMLTERSIDAGEGAQLDGIGTIVGQERLGYADPEYRGLLRARIKVNRSSGTGNNLIEITRLAEGDPELAIELTEPEMATALLRIAGSSAIDSAVVNTLLQDARAAGVKLYVEAYDGGDDAPFLFAVDDTPVAGSENGFGDDADPDVGGRLSSVYGE